MFLFKRPSEAEIEGFVSSQRELPFSYREVGGTRGEAPRGYVADRYRVELGEGEEAYERAKEALRSWRQFGLGWVGVHPNDAPIKVGATVAVLARHAGVWSLNSARIVYLVEEGGGVERFGFAYGTLPGHAERGEERFLVEHDRRSGAVSYDVFAFSRPGHPLAWLGYPFARLLQRRFARDSKEAMRRAVVPSKQGRAQGPSTMGLILPEQMYDSIADWWPVISPPSEYAEEAAIYVDMIRDAARGPVREVLELGSGGGNNASHMKRAFALTLVEPAERMRELSRALNPECTHLPGDMRDVRLGRTFDAVFVHDAVMYMTTEDDLRAALVTVAAHLAPDGVALVAPDATAETFSEATEHGGGEDASERRARYLEWTLPPAPGGTSFETHYAFLLREPDGTLRVAHDVHHEGIFPRATWLRLFREAGLAAELVPRKIEGVEYDSFVANRAAP